MRVGSVLSMGIPIGVVPNIYCLVYYSGYPPPWHAKPSEDKLLDLHKLAQRQKQIDMGKETVGYELYTKQIPK